MITFKPTERGFQRGEFLDRCRQQCSLQESSLATESAIWLGVDVNTEGVKVGERMHLTDEQLKFLLPSLIHFFFTGELTGADANNLVAVAANALSSNIHDKSRRDKLAQEIAEQLTPEAAKLLAQALSRYNVNR